MGGECGLSGTDSFGFPFHPRVFASLIDRVIELHKRDVPGLCGMAALGDSQHWQLSSALSLTLPTLLDMTFRLEDRKISGNEKYRQKKKS